MATTTTTPTTKLPKEIFEVEVSNHELVKLAYDSYLAAGREVSATTKERGEVRGGGKKPWNQKGTGRARVGSSRNPIWRGGGIVFGPRGNENYTKKISTTSKRVAIKQALTLAHKAKKVVVLDLKTIGKTKDATAFLAKHDLQRRVLLVVDQKTPELLRATNNVQSIKLVNANYLNVYDILNAHKIVLSTKSIDIIKTWLTGGSK